MRFREAFLQPQSNTVASTMMASRLGSSRFKYSLDKEQLKTPHYRMDKCLQMLEERPSTLSGLTQIIRFLIQTIEVKSSDKVTVEFYRNFFKNRPQLRDQIELFSLLLLGAGTSYLEPYKSKTTNGVEFINYFETVRDPSIIFRNLEAKSDDEYWLLQVPVEVRKVGDMTPKYYPFYYIRGATFSRYYVWAIPQHKSKYICHTYGWSRTPYYGGGLLGAAIDNVDIEQEILKNVALVAKYRSLGKKIFSFTSPDNEPISPEDLESLKTQFNSLEEEESMLVNKKVEQVDIAFMGQDNMLENQREFLYKDTGSTLVPNFMTAMSQDSSMATAQEAKIPFSLQLEALSSTLENIFNEVILANHREAFPFLDKEAKIYFGRPELYSRDMVFNWISMLYNNKACTFNELRMAAGLEPVENGDEFPKDENAIPLDKLSAPTQQDTAPQDSPTPITERLKTDKTFKEAWTLSSRFTQPPQRHYAENGVKIGTPLKVPTDGVLMEQSKNQFSEAVKDLLGK